MYKQSGEWPNLQDFLRISHKSMTKHIKRFGWSVLQVVDPIGETWAFEYTIGNYACGLPELLIVGTLDGMLINDVTVLMRKRNRPFENGELVDAGCRHPFKVINADKMVKAEYTVQVGEYFGTQDYRVQQVLLPDRAGRFAGDPLCAEPHSWMPVFFEIPDRYLAG